jgi:hypothetical protein
MRFSKVARNGVVSRLLAAVALLLMAVWLSSAWVSVSWVDSDLRGYALSAGCFEYFRAPGPTIYVISRRTPGWNLGRTRPRPALRLVTPGWEYEWGSASEFLDVPLWPLFALPGSAAIVLWVAAYREVRRLRLLRCIRCAYNRRGLPPNTNCPECGTVPAPAPK